MSTNNRPFIIGITGGSASGKTLFLTRLMEQFDTDDICLLSQDNYYRPKEHQTKDENGIENFDLPGAIDDVAFAADVEKLRSGEIVTREEYTFNNSDKIPNLLHFYPKKILVVEGIFVFHFPEVAKLLDLKIFIDAQDKIKLKRRIKRDNEERGYDLQDVMYRWYKFSASSSSLRSWQRKLARSVRAPTSCGLLATAFRKASSALSVRV